MVFSAASRSASFISSVGPLIPGIRALRMTPVQGKVNSVPLSCFSQSNLPLTVLTGLWQIRIISPETIAPKGTSPGFIIWGMLRRTSLVASIVLDGAKSAIIAVDGLYSAVSVVSSAVDSFFFAILIFLTPLRNCSVGLNKDNLLQTALTLQGKYRLPSRLL